MAWWGEAVVPHSWAESSRMRLGDKIRVVTAIRYSNIAGVSTPPVSYRNKPPVSV